MKRNLIFTRQWLVTALFLVIGLSSYGCADTASVSEDVAAPLASLTITPGALQPAFFANTTNYAVNAPTSATSVTVTAVPKDKTAIVTIDGFVTSQRSVTLGSPGSTTTILIVVETQTGLETTYTVTVTRLLSSDNNLSALSVKVGTTSQTLLPDFDANIQDYTVNVPDANAGSVTVSATKSDLNATIVINGQGTSSGQAIILIGVPGTTTLVTIEVTAPNGSKKTYRITVNHLSGDNNLSALTVKLDPSGTNLINNFDPNTTSYTVDVASTVTSVEVSATKSDPNAVLSGSIADPGAGQATGQTTIPLNGAGTPTLVSITVTPPNGDFKTYTITVNRRLSDNNNLSALTVKLDPSGTNLINNFDPNTTSYTVDVASTVTSVEVS
ncbi:MAG: cadherin-like beta sandwich domain-containing protein, partial [Nitrospira sp.]|nr:cadherin-like beta sandwich domain-containing protein [Nitrospira sp.]